MSNASERPNLDSSSVEASQKPARFTEVQREMIQYYQKEQRELQDTTWKTLRSLHSQQLCLFLLVLAQCVLLVASAVMLHQRVDCNGKTLQQLQQEWQPQPRTCPLCTGLSESPPCPDEIDHGVRIAWIPLCWSSRGSNLENQSPPKCPSVCLCILAQPKIHSSIFGLSLTDQFRQERSVAVFQRFHQRFQVEPAAKISETFFNLSHLGVRVIFSDTHFTPFGRGVFNPNLKGMNDE